MKRKSEKCLCKVVANLFSSASTFYGDEKLFSEINVGQDTNLEKKLHCTMGEEIFIKSNIYQNIEHISNEMKTICDIPGQWEWVCLGCYGYISHSLTYEPDKNIIQYTR